MPHSPVRKPPGPLTPALRARLQSPAWAWLTGPVRGAYVQRGDDVATITIDFDDLPDEAASGYAGVLRQRRLPAGTVKASRRTLDAALQDSALGRTSRELLLELFGSLPNRAADRAADRAQRDSAWLEATQHPAVRQHPALAGWLEAERAGGRLPADAEQRATLLRQSCVLQILLTDLREAATLHSS